MGATASRALGNMSPPASTCKQDVEPSQSQRPCPLSQPRHPTGPTSSGAAVSGPPPSPCLGLLPAPAPGWGEPGQGGVGVPVRVRTRPEHGHGVRGPFA